MKTKKTVSARRVRPTIKAPVRHGWAVQIIRKDKTTFLASAGCGCYPAVWGQRNRGGAVAYNRELREHVNKCRVVPVTFRDPVVMPNAGTEARVLPSPPVTVGRPNQTTKGE